MRENRIATAESIQGELAADLVLRRATDHRKIDKAVRRQQALQHQPGLAVARRRDERMPHDLRGIDLCAARQRRRRRHIETDPLGADDFGRNLDFLARCDEEAKIGGAVAQLCDYLGVAADLKDQFDIGMIAREIGERRL